MSGFLGADVETLREHAGASRRAAETLRALVERCRALVETTEWIGADADSFRTRWGSEVSPRLDRAVQDLEADGQELDSHAEEQDETSGTGTGGGGGTGGVAAARALLAQLPGIGTLPESPVGRMIAGEPDRHLTSVLPQFPGADLMVCDVGPRDRIPQELVPGGLGLEDRLIRCFPDPPTPTWPVPTPLPDVQLPDPVPAPVPLPDLRPLPDLQPLPAPLPDSWPLPQPLPAPLPLPDPWPFPEPMPRLDVHRI